MVIWTKAGLELQAGVLELGADADRRLGHRLDLGIDEGDLAAESLLLDRQRLPARELCGWISTTWPTLTR